MESPNHKSFISKIHGHAGAIKFIIVLTVLIDVIGIGIVIPALPYYLESFGASPFVVTLLVSVFALFSFVSGPFLGALSDRIGRRPVLIISIASTALGWFVFAWGKTLWVLFLGRIIDGAAAGNFPIAQSYLVDIAKDDKERTANLGLIGAMWGVGLILGPAIGGSLSAISPALPFLFVGVLATLNTLGALFFLPETHHKRDNNKKLYLNPLRPLLNAAKDKVLLPRYIAWLLFGIAFAAMNAVFALYVKDVFDFSATTAGYLFTGMGVILVFNQMFALKKIWLKYFKEIDLEIWFFLTMAIGFILADVKNIFVFMFGLLFFTFSHSTLRVVISSGVVGAAGAMRRGEVLGIMASILSLALIIGPIMAGALFEKNVSYPFIANVFLLIICFFLMRKCYGQNKITEEFDVQPLG